MNDDVRLRILEDTDGTWHLYIFPKEEGVRYGMLSISSEPLHVIYSGEDITSHGVSWSKAALVEVLLEMIRFAKTGKTS